MLSFPAGEWGWGVAGDLPISLERAGTQAARFGHSLGDEVRVLLLHGVLHLAGFDHEEDAGGAEGGALGSVAAGVGAGDGVDCAGERARGRQAGAGVSGAYGLSLAALLAVLA